MSAHTEKLSRYIGKRLSDKRQALGLSLSQLANRLNISEKKLQEYKCGQSAIHSTLLYQIASILKVDFNYFFEGFPHSTPSTESNSQTIIRTDLEKPLKVLLIDDNAEDTYLTKKAFDASSIPVTLYSMNDGTESLLFLRNQTTHQSRPDIILLNLHLPKVDGLNILHELKQDDTLSDIPVIILSGSTNKNDISTCYQKYASGYMCKLFDFNLFKTNIQNFTRYWAHTVVLPSSMINDI